MSEVPVSVDHNSIGSWSPKAKRTVTAVSIGLSLYSMGFGLTAATMANRVNDIGDKAILLGLLGLAEFFPVFSLVLVTGSRADRKDRKQTVMAAQAAAVVGILAMFANSSGSDKRLWPYYLGAVLLGACRAFMSPSFRPMIPAAVTPAQMPRAMSFYSASWQVAFALGPLLFFIYGKGPKWAFLMAAGLCLGGLIATSFIPGEVGKAHLEHVPAEKPSFHEAIEGLTIIRTNPILLGAIALDLAAVLFGGAVALLPRLSKNELHLGAWDQGLLRSSGGVGAVVVAIAMARKPLSRNIGRWLLVVVGLYGIFTVGLGLAPSLLIACIAHAGLMGADSISVFIRSTVVPLVTPSGQQGRVAAVESVFIGASNELGAAESGVAGQFLGTRGGIVSGGVLTILVVSLWWKFFPPLRNLDRFADAEQLGSTVKVEPSSVQENQLTSAKD
jgi:MFS family permease